MTHKPGEAGSLLRQYASFFWLTATVILCAWVAIRLGITDLSRALIVDGKSVDVPNTFGYVDHPFHASRAVSLLESIRDGNILRWMGQHQGGYPVEFYPLGVAWIDVAIYSVLFGTVPMVAVHKITVILLFLLPAVSYWILARGDRLNPAAAFLATAIHFAVPGTWLNGGFTELVGWGLVTNVAGGSLAMLTAACLTRYVLNHEPRYGIAAILTASAAAMCNPRSLFAIVVVALALLIVGPLAGVGQTERARAIETIRRLATVGGLAVLISAPVIFALFRYNGLYFFLHYQNYENLDAYWLALQNAMTADVAKLAMIGVLWAAASMIPQLSIRLSVSRALAVAAILYAFLTSWVAGATSAPPLVEQLEAPRLMPFQRQLMIWLCAMVVISVLSRATEFMRSHVDLTRIALTGIAAAWMAFWMFDGWVWNNTEVLPEKHGLPRPGLDLDAQKFPFVGTTDIPEFGEIERAVRAADEAAPGESAIFVVGNRQEWWHEQLWAPSYSQARFYYDDWMWYWHSKQTGPYDPNVGYAIPDPSDAMNARYFADHGIGAVLVTDMWVPNNRPSPKQTAKSNPDLSFVASYGPWDLYTVKSPGSIVTDGGNAPVSSDIGNERITATFENGDGKIVIRQNWFPRWRATVNGEDAEIVRRDDGYMEITAPAGRVDVELTYGVTAVDWLARACSVAGVAGTLAFAAPARTSRRWSIPGRRRV